MHIFLFLIHSVSCSKYIYFESLLSLSCFPSQTNHNDFQLNPVSNLSTVCSFHNSLYLDFISGLHLWTQAFFFFLSSFSTVSNNHVSLQFRSNLLLTQSHIMVKQIIHSLNVCTLRKFLFSLHLLCQMSNRVEKKL